MGKFTNDISTIFHILFMSIKFADKTQKRYIFSSFINKLEEWAVQDSEQNALFILTRRSGARERQQNLKMQSFLKYSVMSLQKNKDPKIGAIYWIFEKRVF